MDTRLQSENFSLRQQLEALLQEARLNESKMQRFDLLERRLIGAASLVELVRLLLAEYKAAFGIEHVTLALVDRDYEASRVFDGETDARSMLQGLTVLRSHDALAELYGTNRGPCLGAYDARLHRDLFNAPAGAIASVALLPLTRQGELIGSLHFGSVDADRYAPDCGTDFLRRLSAIVGVCLESALNQERLKLIGLTDGLTGVQNRRYFDHRLQVEISQARRYRHALACMFLDIDKFKRINDTHGHQAGDDVLRSLAGAIQSQLRAGDTVARYGGEEFVVLLPQAARQYAIEIAERIRSTIEKSDFQSPVGPGIAVTISIGLAMLGDGEPGESVQEQALRLIATADAALYRAKNQGRNRVVTDAGPPASPVGGRRAGFQSVLQFRASRIGRSLIAMFRGAGQARRR